MAVVKIKIKKKTKKKNSVAEFLMNRSLQCLLLQHTCHNANAGFDRGYEHLLNRSHTHISMIEKH